MAKKDDKSKKKDSGPQSEINPKAEDFLQVFKRGVQFTEELLS